MLDSYQAYHLPSPQIIDGGDYVKCVLSRPMPYRKYSEEKELRTKILALFLVHPELPTKEIIKSLGVARTTLHRELTLLLVEGVLERIGHTQATRYRLAG